MITRTRVLLVLVLVLTVAAGGIMSGCGGEGDGQQTTEQQGTPAPAEEQTSTASPTEETPMYTPEYKPNGKEKAVLTTSKGEITVELYGSDAPIHVGSFVELAEKGFYEGTKFHRYVADFVIQGGDPATKDATSDEVAGADGDPYSPFGKSGPGYQIRGEFDPAANPNRHVEGALGMARSQSPDSAGSQFYFALAPLPQLDGGYTVFGKVTKGLDVVKSLRAGDVLEKVEIVGATK